MRSGKQHIDQRRVAHQTALRWRGYDRMTMARKSMAIMARRRALAYGKRAQRAPHSHHAPLSCGGNSCARRQQQYRRHQQWRRKRINKHVGIAIRRRGWRAYNIMRGIAARSIKHRSGSSSSIIGMAAKGWRSNRAIVMWQRKNILRSKAKIAKTA